MNVGIKFTWHSVVQPIVDYMMKMMLFVDHEFHPIPYQVDMIVHYIMMMVFVFYCYLLHVHLYNREIKTKQTNKINTMYYSYKQQQQRKKSQRCAHYNDYYMPCVIKMNNKMQCKTNQTRKTEIIVSKSLICNSF